jgi:hypothetical protein
MTTTTTRDGVVYGMTDAVYHSADMELSSTRAKAILKSPATLQYELTHPKKPKAEFDVGHAAHAKVLGVGADIVVIPDDKLSASGSTNTNAAKAFIEDARSKGLVPIKKQTAAEVDAMAEAVLANAEARELLEQLGNPEASVFATDPDTGVRLRARFDYLPHETVTDPWCIDLKTIGTAADDESFSKQVAKLGYDVQQEHYLHTYGLATGDFSARMKFIVVESDPPHLVKVHELAHEFGEIGAARARKARHLFAEALATGVWRGYEPSPLPLQPPLWHIYANQELLQS